MASLGGNAQSTEFKKVAAKQYPSIKQRATAETRHWRKFNFPITVKGHATINSINFFPSKPFDFAVSSSTRVCTKQIEARLGARKVDFSNLHMSL
jgi:hypothetical protein